MGFGTCSSNNSRTKDTNNISNGNITVERVYETLFKIAKLEGTGSQDMKIKYISSLLNDANPLEASFILKIYWAL